MSDESGVSGWRWVIVGVEMLVVAPTFAVFVPGAYIGLTTTTMLMLTLGGEERFDWALELTLLALSAGAALGLLGLALAIPLSSSFLAGRPWLRGITVFGLVAGLLAAGTGLFFVLRDVGGLDGMTLLMWLGLLGAPMVVGGRHLYRITRVRDPGGRDPRTGDSPDVDGDPRGSPDALYS